MQMLQFAASRNNSFSLFLVSLDSFYHPNSLSLSLSSRGSGQLIMCPFFFFFFIFVYVKVLQLSPHLNKSLSSKLQKSLNTLSTL